MVVVIIIMMQRWSLLNIVVGVIPLFFISKIFISKLFMVRVDPEIGVDSEIFAENFKNFEKV